MIQLPSTNSNFELVLFNTEELRMLVGDPGANLSTQIIWLNFSNHNRNLEPSCKKICYQKLNQSKDNYWWKSIVVSSKSYIKIGRPIMQLS